MTNCAAAELAGVPSSHQLTGLSMALILIPILYLMPPAASVLQPQPQPSPQAATVKVRQFEVPSQVRVGELKRLSCRYELHGATLHAMKIFKDNEEFYRFTPSEPHKQTFRVAGVEVDGRRANNERDVYLKINRRSAGTYKCQVLVEGTFNSVSAEKRMELLQGGAANQTKSAFYLVGDGHQLGRLSGGGQLAASSLQEQRRRPTAGSGAARAPLQLQLLLVLLLAVTTILSNCFQRR